MDILKEYLRMCNEINKCNKCPIYIKSETASCSIWMNDHYDEAVSIIRKWAEEHTQKTYAQDFLEKFPKAPKDDNGRLSACVESVYGVNCPKYSKLLMTCKDCWDRPMEE